MRITLRCAVTVVLVAVIGLGACGDDDDTPASGTGGGAAEHDDHDGHGSDEDAAFPLDEADVTVKVAMNDFAFTGIPSSVEGKKVLFEVTNEGPSDHEFVLFEQGGEDAVRGIRPFAKTKTQLLAVELEPGSYTVKCLVELGNQTHADLGMQTDFKVG